MALQADADAWKLRLSPWLAALRSARLYANIPPLPTAGDLERLWFVLHAPDPEENPDDWPWLAEAMELLVLLVRLDPRIGWLLLFEVAVQPQVAKRYTELLLSSDSVVEPRFRIFLHQFHLDFQVYTWVELKALAGTAFTSSVLYQEVKALLHRSRDEPPLELSLYFYFDVGFENDREMEFALNVVCRIASDFHRFAGEDPRDSAHHEGERDEAQEETAFSAHRERFLCDSFELDFGEEVVFTTSLLLKLQHLSYRGVRITTMFLSDFVSERLGADQIRGFLQTFIEPHRTRWRGVKTLELDPEAFDVRGLEAVVIAVSHSYSLTDLEANPGRMKLRNCTVEKSWSWLAYMLFSSHAEHAIYHATLDMYTFDLASLQAVRRVLRSNNPTRTVREITGTSMFLATASSEDDDDDQGSQSPSPTVGVKIGTGAVVIFNPCGASQSKMEGFYEDDLRCVYRVIRDDGNLQFIQVVIPSRGVCWVDRKFVVDRVSMPPHKTHPIRHLTLKSIRDESREATLALLQLIGGPIKRLAVAECFQPLDDRFFKALVDHCPNLVRLDLNCVKLQSLEWLRKLPRCRIESLSFNGGNLGDGSMWKVLFEVLGDRNHPLARSLQHLQFNFYQGMATRGATTRAQDAIVGYAVAMLPSNVRLQRCQWFQCADKVVDKYTQQILTQDNKPVAVEEAPLAPGEILAFLSVLTPPNTSRQPKRAKAARTTYVAHYQLIPETVESILEFAAKPKKRVCDIYGESDLQAELHLFS